MKNVMIYLCCLFLWNPGVRAGDLDQAVTTIEVPVRVFSGDQPVRGLIASDFLLRVGGEVREITQLTYLEKSLPGSHRQITASRTFVLVFQITDFNSAIEKGVKYLLEEVLRRGDDLIMVAGLEQLSFLAIKDKKEVKRRIWEFLDRKSEEKKVRMKRMIAYYQGRHRNIKVHVMEDLVRELMEIWNLYKKSVFLPDLNWCFSVPAALQHRPGEKWVISFYQLEDFPVISLPKEWRNRLVQLAGNSASNGPLYAAFGQTLQHQIYQIDYDLDLTRDIPFAEIQRLFYNGGGSLVSILMKSKRRRLCEDYNYKRSLRSLEKGLEKLALATGGYHKSSREPEQVLKGIHEVHAGYYLLSFRGSGLQKPGDLEVKVKKDKYKVIYGNLERTGKLTGMFGGPLNGTPLPQIRVGNFSIHNGRISFEIADYMFKQLNGQLMGAFQVQIKVLDEGGKPVFNRVKKLNALDKVTRISLPLGITKFGDYKVEINVVDFLARKNASLANFIHIKEQENQ